MRFGELAEIVILSLRVSGTALLFSTMIGIPVGAWIGLTSFRARRFAIVLAYTGMGLPPVVVGLVVYLLLSHSGPMGFLGWLFTSKAMVLAQAIIALPMVTGLTMAAVAGVDPNLRQQARSLGASSWQSTVAVLLEARHDVIVSVVAGFGSIISEVGAVIMVGGNIEGHTRVLTTAIVLETRKGNFQMALALGGVLLTLALAINAVVLLMQLKLGQ